MEPAEQPTENRDEVIKSPHWRRQLRRVVILEMGFRGQFAWQQS
jgi:hypothetical protein